MGWLLHASRDIRSWSSTRHIRFLSLQLQFCRLTQWFCLFWMTYWRKCWRCLCPFGVAIIIWRGFACLWTFDFSSFRWCLCLQWFRSWLLGPSFPSWWISLGSNMDSPLFLAVLQALFSSGACFHSQTGYIDQNQQYLLTWDRRSSTLIGQRLVPSPWSTSCSNDWDSANNLEGNPFHNRRRSYSTSYCFPKLNQILFPSW